ncbi:MAG TPA: NUDIX domain-containing protein, partial [Phycisphaerae bacterium]
MPRTSAGLLMYRVRDGVLEVLLVHPGGPFWRNKDAGAWTIPKGEVAPDEDEFSTAVREFREETGMAAAGPFIDLGTIKQKAGKIVHAWAFAGDCDLSTLRSNMTRLEWPRGS